MSLDYLNNLTGLDFENKYLVIEPKTQKITATEKNWFGRMWEVMKSFFGQSTLQKTALLIEPCLTNPQNLTEAHKKALTTLDKKITKFNSSFWHPGVNAALVEKIRLAITPTAPQPQQPAPLAQPQKPPFMPPQAQPQPAAPPQPGQQAGVAPSPESDIPLEILEESLRLAEEAAQKRAKEEQAQQAKAAPQSEISPEDWAQIHQIEEEARKSAQQEQVKPAEAPPPPAPEERRRLIAEAIEKRTKEEQAQTEVLEKERRLAEEAAQNRAKEEQAQQAKAAEERRRLAAEAVQKRAKEEQAKVTPPPKDSEESKRLAAEAVQKAQPFEVTEEEAQAKIKEIGIVDLPPVGELKTEFSKIYPDLAVKSPAPALIEKHFTACRIKGDGHCMFRGVSVALFEKYAQNPDALSALVQRTGAAPQKYPFPEGCLQSINKSIEELRKHKSIQEILCDKEISLSWVAFLRILAANHIFSLPPEKLDEHLYHMALEIKNNECIEELGKLQDKLEQIQRDANSEEAEVSERATQQLAPTQRELENSLAKWRTTIVSQYLASKIDMTEKDPNKTYGTDLELIALSSVLEEKIGVLDFRELHDNIKKGMLFGYIFPKHITFARTLPEDTDLFLIFQGNHYDTLFKK